MHVKKFMTVARRHAGLLALTLGLAALAALAVTRGSGRATEATRPSVVQVARGGRLWITGTSSLHAWESEATTFDVSASLKPSATRATAGGLEGQIRSGGLGTVDIVIPVADMHSEKSGLDKNMRKALQADQNPRIACHLERYTVEGAAAADSFVVRAAGTLAVSGVPKPVEVVAQAWRETAGIRFRGSCAVLMSDHGIKPPTMMMGTIKTGDRVVVHFDLVLAAADAASAARP